MKPTSELASKLAAEVRAELGRKGITTTALAQFMGMHRNTVGKLLWSKQAMDIDDLVEIALMVGVEPEVLVARAAAAA